MKQRALLSVPDPPAHATPEQVQALFAEHMQAFRQLITFCGLRQGLTESPPHSLLTAPEMLALCTTASKAPPGSFVEVGVYRGGSAFWLMLLAQQQRRAIYLYDTFTGMPYSDPTIDSIAVGDVNMGNHTSEAQVRAALGDYSYIEACVFPHAIALPFNVAFAHIDVDQYQSHIDTCKALEPRMVPGGIMYFDDVPVLESARKAVRELYEDRIEKVDHGRWLVRF